MSIKLNGTTFNNGGTCTFNGSTVKKINFVSGGTTTTVWQAQQSMSDLTASPSGGPAVTNTTVSFTSSSYWNMTNYTSITFTISNDVEVYYWASGGTVVSQSRATYLVLNDGTEINLNATSGSKTVSLSSYTSTQRSKVYLRAKLTYNITTVTNSAYRGSATATNAIAT